MYIASYPKQSKSPHPFHFSPQLSVLLIDLVKDPAHAAPLAARRRHFVPSAAPSHKLRSTRTPEFRYKAFMNLKPSCTSSFDTPSQLETTLPPIPRSTSVYHVVRNIETVSQYYCAAGIAQNFHVYIAIDCALARATKGFVYVLDEGESVLGDWCSTRPRL